MKKEIIITGISILILIGVVFAFSNTINQNKVISFATAEQEQVRMAENDKLKIEIDDETYTLYALDVDYNRKEANFAFKSDSGLQVYFELDTRLQSFTKTEKGEQSLIRPQKSKTIPLKEKELYIELVSIKNRKANLIIKEQ